MAGTAEFRAVGDGRDLPVVAVMLQRDDAVDAAEQHAGPPGQFHMGRHVHRLARKVGPLEAVGIGGEAAGPDASVSSKVVSMGLQGLPMGRPAGMER
jgi:hypothetical protein